MTETIVVKAGGDIVEDDEYLRYLAADIKLLHDRGDRLALVYGGKKRITEEMMLQYGIQGEFSSGGMRVTTDKTIDAVQYALDRLGEDVAGFFKVSGFRDYDL